jgi:hypothetical protein
MHLLNALHKLGRLLVIKTGEVNTTPSLRTIAWFGRLVYRSVLVITVDIYIERVPVFDPSCRVVLYGTFYHPIVRRKRLSGFHTSLAFIPTGVQPVRLLRNPVITPVSHNLCSQTSARPNKYTVFD